MTTILPRSIRFALSLVALLTLVVLASPVGAHAAAATPSPGSTGYDVSYPQCGVSLPSDGSFAIVGVTDGLPWSTNPCLAHEYAWAASRSYSALYMNTANPAPTSSFYWPQSGSRDPALCIDSTSTVDGGCAYDYGWHAAANALASAQAAIGPAAGTVDWWLDVEIGNSWNGDAFSNAADIQGSIDYLRSQGIPAVGIYSTSEQWSFVTGGYTVSNASTYARQWAAAFVPRYPLVDSSDWVAGAPSLAAAAASCGVGFTGGVTQFAQYGAGPFGTDLACPASIPASRHIVPGIARDGL